MRSSSLDTLKVRPDLKQYCDPIVAPGTRWFRLCWRKPTRRHCGRLRFRVDPVQGEFGFEVEVLIEPRFEDQIFAPFTEQRSADALLVERHLPKSRVSTDELQPRRRNNVLLFFFCQSRVERAHHALTFIRPDQMT